MEWTQLDDVKGGAWALYSPDRNPVVSIVRVESDFNNPKHGYICKGDRFDTLDEAKAAGEASLSRGSIQVVFRGGDHAGTWVIPDTDRHGVIERDKSPPLRHNYVRIGRTLVFDYEGAEPVS